MGEFLDGLDEVAGWGVGFGGGVGGAGREGLGVGGEEGEAEAEGWGGEDGEGLCEDVGYGFGLQEVGVELVAVFGVSMYVEWLLAELGNDDSG